MVYQFGPVLANRLACAGGSRASTAIMARLAQARKVAQGHAVVFGRDGGHEAEAGDAMMGIQKGGNLRVRAAETR